MSAEDLEWYRQRFESLKGLFQPGPELKRAILRIRRAGVPSGDAAILERETRLREAALEYLAAMLEQVDAFSEEGMALRREILDFLEKHRETKESQEREKDAGRSLGRWIEDRDGGWYMAPAIGRPDEAGKARLPDLRDYIAKKYPKMPKK